MDGRSMVLRRGLVGVSVVIASTFAGSGAAGADEDIPRLRYVAAPGEANDLTIEQDGGDLVITDIGAAALPTSLAGCTPVAVPAGVSARCSAPGELIVHLELGDLDDHILADMLLPQITLHVDAGDGDDIIELGDGDDRIVGGLGDDTLYGGFGDDRIIGQEGDDWLDGSPGADTIDGGAGFDALFGKNGADVLSGGGNVDFIFAGGGNDVADGGAAADYVEGEGGDDTLRGGGGADELKGNGGSDTMDGEAGDDLIRARDDEADSIRCGAGDDIARIDGGIDSVHEACEKVRSDID